MSFKTSTRNLGTINGSPDLSLLSNNITLQTNNTSGATSNTTLDATFPQGSGFDSVVSCVKYQSDGKMIVGGNFVRYTDSSNSRLTRFNIDGTTDITFNVGSGFDSLVSTFEIQPSDGKILVGGDFLAYSGVTRNRIIRLNTNGSIDNTFAIGSGFDANILSIAIQSNGKILVGGSFTSYSGVTCNRIVRLNTNGTIDSSFISDTGFDLDVFAIAIQSNGKILVGGGFSSYSGVTAQSIIRLNTNGSIDDTFTTGDGFDPGFASFVEVIKIQPSDGKILVGGFFTIYSGVTVSNNIIRLNTNGTVDSGFNSGTGTDVGFNSVGVDTIAIQSNNKIIIGGDFGTYSGVTVGGSIVRLNSNGTIDNTFVNGSGFDSTVRFIDIRTSDGKILIGGDFNNYNSIRQHYITELSSTGSQDNIFRITNSGFVAGSAQINSISVQTNNKIIVGGTFTSYSGGTKNRIIRLNTDTTIDSSFVIGIGFNNSVISTAIQSDGKILVGGTFTTYSGATRNRIIRLNTIGTIDTSFVIGSGFSSGQVNTFAIQTDNKILAGGTFTSYSGGTRNRIIRLNTNGGIDSTFSIGTGFNANVNSIALQTDNKIIVGGSFTTYTGSTRNRIVRLNIDASIDSSFAVGTAFNAAVNAVAIQNDGKILIGGSFTTYTGSTRNRIVRLNTNGSVDTTFNVGTGFNNVVNSIVIQSDGKIIVGGAFTSYNGTTKNRIIRLNIDGSIDSFFIMNNTGFDNSILTIAIQGTNFYVGGSFTKYDNKQRISLARFSVGTLYRLLINSINGIEYTSDFSANYTNRSLVDNGFVVSLISSTITGATNGIVKINRNIKLGGALTGATTIGLGTNNLIFTGTTGTLRYGSDLSNQYTSRSLIDKGYLDSVFGTGSTLMNTTTFTSNFGTVDPAFILVGGFNGNVNTIAVQADGKIILGGAFSAYSGTSRSEIIRLNENGIIDNSFVIGSGFNAIPLTIAIQQDGKIVIGGSFTSYSGVTCNRIVRLNTNGSIDNTFVVGSGFDNNVSSILIQNDGKILAGGAFTTYSGATRNGIIRLNTNGTIDTSFIVGTAFGGSPLVSSMALNNSGKIIVGGAFTTYSGASIFNIIRLNSNGSLDISFNIGNTWNFSTLCVTVQPDGKVLAGGNFSSPTSGSIRFNTDGSRDNNFNAGGSGFAESVRSIVVLDDGRIVVGGDFLTYNGASVSNYFLSLNKDGSLDTTLIPGVFGNNIDVIVKGTVDGTLSIGGNFLTYNGSSYRRFIKLNANGYFNERDILRYNFNNSKYFTNHSIVDVAYVTGITSTLVSNITTDIKITTVGKGLYIKEGTNATSGVKTLTGGTAVVNTTKVTANSRIQLTSQSDGGTPGFVRVSTRSAGTSFTITSSSGSDTSVIGWFIIEPS